MCSESRDLTGRCLCGAVRFRGKPAGQAARCHCEQCLRWSGDTWAAVTLDEADVIGDSLRWYRSSGLAERGFCVECGASLFWRRVGSDTVDAAMGCIDAPTGMALSRHIFTAFKGDYYQITDGLPQETRE